MRFHLVAKVLVAIGSAFALMGYSHAQTNILLDMDTGRTEGILPKNPVFLRAIIHAKPAAITPSNDIALLFFRGGQGVWRFKSASDIPVYSNRPVLQEVSDIYKAAGITRVFIDCPTDELGTVAVRATSCFDGFRASKTHADDIRSIISKLKTEYGYTRFYIMGHSFGTISSRWLAKNLGAEINGSIHSASMNVTGSFPPFGNSFRNFPYDSLIAPQLHIHNEADACPSTPYGTVKAYAGSNLTTVKGGIPEGEPCGGGHFHSFQGREVVVAKTVVNWILTGQVEKVIGE